MIDPNRERMGKLDMTICFKSKHILLFIYQYFKDPYTTGTLFAVSVTWIVLPEQKTAQWLSRREGTVALIRLSNYLTVCVISFTEQHIRILADPGLTGSL